MKILGFIIIVLFLVISCDNTKPQITRISGVVLDYYSGSEIPNVNVRIRNTSQDPSQQQLMTSNPYESTQIIGLIPCDFEGHFFTQFENLPNADIKLVLYTDTLISVESYDILVGGQNNFEVKVKKLVDFKVKLKNVNPKVSSIRLDINNEDKVVEYRDLESIERDSAWNTKLIYYSDCNFKLNINHIDLGNFVIDTTIYISDSDSITFKDI